VAVREPRADELEVDEQDDLEVDTSIDDNEDARKAQDPERKGWPSPVPFPNLEKR
jgi:hypothetical protein